MIDDREDLAETGTDDQWPIHVPSVGLEDRIHHDRHMLLWQVRGESDFVLGGVPRSLAAGHVLWLPAGTHHCVRVHPNSVLLPMSFLAATTATTLSATTQVVVDRTLRTVLLALLQSQISALKTAVNLERQVLAIIEREPAPTTVPLPTSGTARSVAEALRFNPGDDRTVTEHAESVHTSYKTIERAFLAETGLTFRQWRVRNRMEAAASLLRSDTAPGAVANRVGYQNLSAFGRAFRLHFGMTPTAYVRRYR